MEEIKGQSHQPLAHMPWSTICQRKREFLYNISKFIQQIILNYLCEITDML